MSQIDPNAELVRQARSAPEGDLRAFEALVRRLESGVQTNCRFLTRSEHDAEDLAQEVFVKAFFGLKSFEGRSTFQSWVHRIKVNHCLNFLRKRQENEHVDVDDDVNQTFSELHVQASVEREMDDAHRRAMIRATLDAMPETLRVALVLRDFDELSYQEVAEHLGIGMSAAKMRIKRARTDFRERFKRSSRSTEAEAGGDDA